MCLRLSCLVLSLFHMADPHGCGLARQLQVAVTYSVSVVFVCDQFQVCCQLWRCLLSHAAPVIASCFLISPSHLSSAGSKSSLSVIFVGIKALSVAPTCVIFVSGSNLFFPATFDNGPRLSANVHLDVRMRCFSTPSLLRRLRCLFVALSMLSRCWLVWFRGQV